MGDTVGGPTSEVRCAPRVLLGCAGRASQRGRVPRSIMQRGALLAAVVARGNPPSRLPVGAPFVRIGRRPLTKGCLVHTRKWRGQCPLGCSGRVADAGRVRKERLWLLVVSKGVGGDCLWCNGDL